jgi:hypothetical protein
VIDAMERNAPSRRGHAPATRGIVARLLFPPIHARFRIAILLTFFPYGILYPLDYPAGELLTICCWIWVFPSRIGWASLVLAPLIPDQTYGYYAFNLFCLIANPAIALSAIRSRELVLRDFESLHSFVRGCMSLALAIGGLQAVTDPFRWMAVFTNMRLESGRGAGLRLEPSQFSCLLVLYLAVLAGRVQFLRSVDGTARRQRALLREGILVILLTVSVTRSFSVLIVVLCFVPVLFVRRKHLMRLMVTLTAGAAVAVFALGDRLSDAVATSGGSLIDLMTAGVDSWRNVPDILIVSNYRDFLLPGNPSEVRIKIHTFAMLMSPLMAWIQNTFSAFSAGGVTVGLAGTAAIMFAVLARGLRSLPSVPMRCTWLLVYLTAWFFMAKWDPSAWVVLGLLPLVHKSAGRRAKQREAMK